MLNDSAIRNARPKEKPYKLTDGNGLYLEVKPQGSRLWRYRYRIGDKENVFAVGEYCQAPAGETGEQGQARRDGRRFTLAEARAERERCRDLIKQGIHPSHNQRIETLRRGLENENTFKAVSLAWITEHGGDWSENYRRQVKQRLEGDAYPFIGVLPIKTIKAVHILGVLDRVKKRSPTMANLLKRWIGGVF